MISLESDKFFMNKPLLFLIISSCIIFSIGLIMVFNTTSAEILNRSLEIDANLALKKQFIYGMLGILIGLFVWVIGYKKILEYSPYLLFGLEMSSCSIQRKVAVQKEVI